MSRGLGDVYKRQGLGLPMSVPYTCVPVGTALMALTSVEVILKNLQELFHKKEGGAA